MSHVTDTVLLLGACQEERMQRWLAIINAWTPAETIGPAFRHKGLVSVDDAALPRGWYGGSKALQCGIAIAAFNYLNIGGFIEFLRGLPWEADEDYSVAVAIKDEHEDKFTLHTIFPRLEHGSDAWLTEQMALLSGYLEDGDQHAFKAIVVADMLNHVLNGHSADSVRGKFGLGSLGQGR